MPMMSLQMEEVLKQLRQQPARVLLVDDEHIVTSSIESYLMLETSHEVMSYNNPSEALNALEHIRPDVVVSDFNMPELTGIEFLKRVKDRFPTVETILLTGYADKENAIAAINEVGIYRYLEKPWDNAHLHSTIEQALERQRLIRGLENSLKKVNKLNETLRGYNVALENTVKQRTQELELARDELEALIRHSGDGIAVLDADGHMELLNPCLQLWLAESHPGYNQFTATPLRQWMPLPTPTPTPHEAITLTLPHTHRALDALVSPLPHSPGRTLWVFRDVTQRQKLDQMRQDFVATLTHDLRTPLQSTLQFYEFFRQGRFGPTSSQQLDMLKVMTESHRDLLSLVNTLLDVYRYESGTQPLVIQELDVFHLMNQSMDALLPLATERETTLELAPCDWAGDKEVFGDVVELKRVLGNLIGNAIKHNPPGTHVKLSARGEAKSVRSWHGMSEEDITPPEHWLGWLMIEVKDNGQGIALKDQAHLFERFSQGTSRKRNSGSGLGLYLAQRIIAQHGGGITLESTEDIGSAFRLWLPVFRAQAKTPISVKPTTVSVNEV
jgi:signal transduction histidine kinase/DNA-binding NarL/FixJ family response regulator